MTTDKPEAPECDHRAHSNPALLVDCPQCGEGWKYLRIRSCDLESLQQTNAELEAQLSGSMKILWKSLLGQKELNDQIQEENERLKAALIEAQESIDHLKRWR